MRQYEVSYNKVLAKERYSLQLRNLKRKVKILEVDKNDSCKNEQLLKQRFNKDQILAMRCKSTKFKKWSNSTITKALKLKSACGNSGYEELIKQKIPLPSLRTLIRRLENLNFDTGILEEAFDFLRVKVQNFKDAHEKDCAIFLDEMAIKPGRTYDAALKKNLGNVTLPGHSGVATHVLVIMLRGTNTRWKQTIAYFFTGNSVNGAAYEQILFNVINKAEDIGLNVLSITSDMGASNQALWRIWNITAGRYSKTQIFIQHPLDPERKIYIFADVPHLF